MFFINRDIMGQALMDYMNGVREYITLQSSAKFDKNVINGDEIFSVYEYFKDEKDLMEVDKKMLSMCYGKVLDIGAAAGSHSLILKERGIDVHSIDISPGAVKVMKKRGLENVYLADINNFKSEKFDTLFFAGNNHGLFGNIEGLMNFFGNVDNILKENGQILISSPYINIQVSNYKYDEELKYLMLDMKLKYKKKTSKVFNWFMISTDYLIELLIKEGWDVQQFKCDYGKTSLIKVSHSRI